jgi:hypothetical protein
MAQEGSLKPCFLLYKDYEFHAHLVPGVLISFQACLPAFAKSIQTSCKLTAPTSDLVPVDLVSPDKPLAMKPGSAAKVLPTVFIKTYGPRADTHKHTQTRTSRLTSV